MRLVFGPDLFALALFALVAGCSSSSSPPQSSFAGTWSCNVADVLTFTVPPNAQNQTPSAIESLAIDANANGGITTTLVTAQGPSCVLDYATSGSAATLANGQSCSGEALTFTYASGSATLGANGSTLSGTLAYSFSGSVALDGGGNESVAGTGTTTYGCTKQ